MFKAKLIEDPLYYRLRWKHLIFGVLPAIPCGFIYNYDLFPFWVSLTMVVFYIVFLYFLIKNSKKQTELTHQSVIELDEDFLRLKSTHQHLVNVINLVEVNSIAIPKDYGIPQESFNDISRELTGKPKKNFILINTKNKNQRFDFVIDSYYMLTQFEKVVDSWTKKGYPIQRI